MHQMIFTCRLCPPQAHRYASTPSAVRLPALTRADALAPPKNARKTPRPEVDLPRVDPDPQSDTIVAIFSGGLFRDDLVPLVRGWVVENTRESPAQVKSFQECFLALGHFNHTEQKSRASSFTASTSIVRSASTRIARHSQHGTLPLPSGADPASMDPLALSLLRVLYGPVLSSMATAERLV